MQKEKIKEYVKTHKKEVAIIVALSATTIALALKSRPGKMVPYTCKGIVGEPVKLSVMDVNMLEKHFPELHKQCLDIGKAVFDSGAVDSKGMIAIGYFKDVMDADIYI